MSKAFTKEDDALPERSGRRRPMSGLPPGAVNYMTADGARRLRAEIKGLPAGDRERAAEFGRILASVTIVEPPEEPPDGAVFGAKVTVRDAGGSQQSYRIVGIEEVHLEPDQVSWISPIGRALLGVEPGQRVKIEVDGEQRTLVVVAVDY